MPLHAACNLGSTQLPRTRRAGNPMQEYDRLPAVLRQWLSEAALPWSPASARRIWVKARANGLSVNDALQSLSKAEARTLARDAQFSPPNQV